MSDYSASLISDPRLQVLLEHAAEAVVVIDEQNHVVGWNPRAERLFGWGTLQDLEDEKSAPALPTLLLQHLESPEAALGSRWQTEIEAPNGQKCPIEVTVTVFAPTATTTSGLLVLHLRDVSAVKAQLRELTNAKEHYRSLLESTAEAIYEADLNGVCTFCNRACVRMLEYDSADELVGRPIHTILRETRPDGSLLPFRETRIYEALRRGAGRHADEENFWTKSGRAVPVEYWCYPIDRDNEIAGVVVTFLDISERKEDALYRAHLAALVESSYDAIIGKDMNGRITSWNTGAQRIYGYTEVEAVGRTIDLILPPHLTQEEPEVRRAIQTGARLEQFETVRRRKDGRLISVSLTVSPITNEEGKIIGSSSIERDFTERKRNEEELRQAKDAAEQASRTRGEFLANVSHELRTPMNAIIGMTQLALEEDLSDEVRDYVGTANDSAHSLLTLLNDILDFSKLESGKFTIDKRPFDLRETLDETVKSLAMRAFEKRLELACEVGSRVPTNLIGDAARLRQVLTNLISNAIKFTEEGEVIVRVEAVRIWRSETVLLFSVTDTGVGIKPEDQGRILEPFTQVDASTTRRHGGTGLGLAICNELLRLMGSRITVHSAPAKGSRFSFRISFGLYSDSEHAGRAPMPLASVRSMHVLVVDDNESNRRIISKALSSWSLLPETAENGEEALRKVEAAKSKGTPFPLIIVDASMPGMDGYELAGRLHQLADPPAIVMMVWAPDRRELRQRPADATPVVFLQKPVSQAELRDAIMRALDVEPQTPAVEDEEDVDIFSSAKPLTVLVAEDMLANQKVVAAILRKRGHRVLIARDGREAVELFGREKFDVVLMDVQMPEMDGLEATVAMRQQEKERGESVAIIAMTAHAMRGDREKCLQAGMDAYLAKPIDVHELLELVEGVGSGSRIGHGIGTADSGIRHLVTTATQVIDIPATLQRLGGDEDLLQSFIGFWDEDYPQLWKSVERAAQSGDAEVLRRAAHSLKGLAANFSAASCVAAADFIEMRSRSGEIANLSKPLDELKIELERLNEALQRYRR